ncbi:efflux transporter outer membrane subunit [Caulobacter sp. UNC279MFTsu5.1]|uniref:efflux transporter outer membrane subunit n=1 Tax=Caulobacter sp. UNC279MFTsu5.1 TaxID=1502775 RepID=UPI00036DB002|nr:efflux transporter outer membrane subunit [Caulobacter sp. UNC279MFTsu5.1]SFK05114.1 efflux transporter, outer membrane factor (OMF) lipoprotein, NodT family [Caulobacter sp. UNC279MFTsu5.1]
MSDIMLKIPCAGHRARGPLVAAVLAAATFLAGCAVGPEFTPPRPSLPSQWRTTAPAATVASAQTIPASTAWWKAFGDPVLDDLEARAGAGNLDVDLAAERVSAARIARGAVRAQSAPLVAGQAGYSRDRASTADVATVAREVLGLAAEPNLPKAVGFDLYTVGAGASWELDLWGGKARQREGAAASLDAARAQARGALLAVQAEAARAYFQLRGLQAEHALRQEALALASDRAAIVQVSRERGLTAGAEAVDAQSRVRSLRQELTGLEQDQASLARALAILVGGDPGQDPFDLAAPAPAVSLAPGPVRLPSDMARQRPDIVAAEAQLHAATAMIGAAKADLYPQISLTGQLSIDVTSLDNFGWGERNTSIGPSISLPLFSGGRLERVVDLRRSEERSAAIVYRQTVINAWREVEDALGQIRALQDQGQEAEADLAAWRGKAAMIEQRHARGDIARAAVLSVQEGVVAAELVAVRQHTAAVLARVQLRRALGG